MSASIRNKPPAPRKDTVTLVVGGRQISGWTAVAIRRGIEMMPSSATIAMTERFPGQPADVVVKPGDPCQLMIGGDVVITGYVDRYVPEVTPSMHGITVAVRGKCEDLVDCSAGIYPAEGNPGYHSRGLVVTASNLVDLATDLCSPFGIKVISLTGDKVPLVQPGGQPVQFNIVLTEKPIEIIERAARYANALVYEAPDGTLVIAPVGTTKHASGVQQGLNAQAFNATFSMDQRYSIYLPSFMSTDVFSNLGTGTAFPSPQLDFGVPRFRPLIVVSEQTQYGVPIAEKRAAWEMQRRRGRSQAVSVTVDSWRDAGGQLWTPNQLVPIALPAVHITDTWLLSEVTFGRNAETGTTAEMVLMPAEAFTVEPSSLQLYDWQVGQDLQQNSGKGAGLGQSDIPTTGAGGTAFG